MFEPTYPDNYAEGYDIITFDKNGKQIKQERVIPKVNKHETLRIFLWVKELLRIEDKK